jgi:hypothetical protein
MAARRVSKDDDPKSRRPPATTPEGRENQLIAAAVDLAEKQIRDGTASAQVISHFLKLGSSREKLEQLRIANEIELMEAKKEQLASQARVEELYKGAITAMRSYAGQEPLALPDDYDD